MDLEHLRDVPLVYFVQVLPDGPIKIGKSRALQRRFVTLQLHSPYELRLLGVIVVSRGKLVTWERRLHKRFKTLRIRGEWFQPAPRLLKYVEDNAVDPITIATASPDEDNADPEGWLTYKIEYQAPRSLLTLQELAKELGIAEATLGRYVRAGTIPCLRIGKQIRFNPGAIYQYLRKLTPTVEAIQEKYGVDPFTADNKPVDVYTFMNTLETEGE